MTKIKKIYMYYLGDGILLFVALLWGIGFVATKLGLNDGVSSLTILSYRFTIASIILLPFSIKNFNKKSFPSFTTYKRGIILGVFLFLGFAFQTFGLSFTTTSKNAFLTAANVVMVPIISYFLFKKKLKLKIIVSAIMSLVGIGLLTINNNLSINIGDLLTLVCAVMFAFHISYTSEFVNKEQTKLLVFIQMLTSMVLSWVTSFIFETPSIPGTKSLLTLVYLGLFSTCIAFFLQTIGQRYAHPAKAAIFLSTESLFGAILGIIVFSDPISPKIVLGSLIMIGTIILTEYK